MAHSGTGIRARIAALNLEEVHGAVPGAQPTYSYDAVGPGKKKVPPPPPRERPPAYQRQQTVNNPPVLSNAPTSARQLGNQPVAVRDAPKVSPALPPRPPPRSNATPRATPALPPRRTTEPSDSTRDARRNSNESTSTIASGISILSLSSVKRSATGHGTSSSSDSMHRIKAPLYDPSQLPPLPSKNAPEDPRRSIATLSAMKSTKDYVPSRSLPPQLKTPDPPARPPLPSRQPTTMDTSLEGLPIITLPATSSASNTRIHKTIAPPSIRSALGQGFGDKSPGPPPPTNRTTTSIKGHSPAPSAPPPIPMGSWPNLAAIMASKPKPGAVAVCLKCRDFSGPDNHAAKFSRTQLPGADVGWLANQLCAPFTSPTDKARAIFTWLHHNVDYDTHSFFSGTVKGTTPEKTIMSGLAVCEGYAGLFAALALKAGLEAMVCSGACKGFNYKPLQTGEPVPVFKSTHAWNAVKIDNSEWKLIDPCWGAGHVGSDNEGKGYTRKFDPTMFIQENNDFGKRHYPTDNSHQFRTDGRILSWEEYCTEDSGGRLTVYTDTGPEHGIGEQTWEPAQRDIKVNDPYGSPMVRFSFACICPHWDNVRHGKGPPYVMLLSIAGRDGRNPEYRPFNTDNRVWWLDVLRTELGVPDQKISVYFVKEFNKKDARGLSYATWNDKKAYSASYGALATWELV